MTNGNDSKNRKNKMKIQSHLKDLLTPPFLPVNLQRHGGTDPATTQTPTDPANPADPANPTDPQHPNNQQPANPQQPSNPANTQNQPARIEDHPGFNEYITGHNERHRNEVISGFSRDQLKKLGVNSWDELQQKLQGADPKPPANPQNPQNPEEPPLKQSQIPDALKSEMAKNRQLEEELTQFKQQAAQEKGKTALLTAFVNAGGNDHPTVSSQAVALLLQSGDIAVNSEGDLTTSTAVPVEHVVAKWLTEYVHFKGTKKAPGAPQPPAAGGRPTGSPNGGPSLTEWMEQQKA